MNFFDGKEFMLDFYVMHWTFPWEHCSKKVIRTS